MKTNDTLGYWIAKADAMDSNNPDPVVLLALENRSVFCRFPLEDEPFEFCNDDALIEALGWNEEMSR